LKYFLFIALGLVLVTTACSDQRKLNKDIQGVWNLTEENGVPVTDYTMKLEFTKFDKKSGDFLVTYAFTDGTPGYTDGGDYYILEAANSIHLTFQDLVTTDALNIVDQGDDFLVVTSAADSTTYRFER
jgi:hypothetical protein